MEPPQVKPLVEVEGLIYVLLAGKTLLVKRSPLIHDDDEYMAPVRELLNRTPHRIAVSEVRENEHMMFGEAIITIYRLETDD